MVLINGVKYACERCIRGHRVTTCTHTDQPLMMIKPKGRPSTQCPHCKEQRKKRNAHISCNCSKKINSVTQHDPNCPCFVQGDCTCCPKSTRKSSKKKEKEILEKEAESNAFSSEDVSPISNNNLSISMNNMNMNSDTNNMSMNMNNNNNNNNNHNNNESISNILQSSWDMSSPPMGNSESLLSMLSDSSFMSANNTNTNTNNINNNRTRQIGLDPLQNFRSSSFNNGQNNNNSKNNNNNIKQSNHQQQNNKNINNSIKNINNNYHRQGEITIPVDEYIKPLNKMNVHFNNFLNNLSDPSTIDPSFTSPNSVSPQINDLGINNFDVNSFFDYVDTGSNNVKTNNNTPTNKIDTNNTNNNTNNDNNDNKMASMFDVLPPTPGNGLLDIFENNTPTPEIYLSSNNNTNDNGEVEPDSLFPLFPLIGPSYSNNDDNSSVINNNTNNHTNNLSHSNLNNFNMRSNSNLLQQATINQSHKLNHVPTGSSIHSNRSYQSLQSLSSNHSHNGPLHHNGSHITNHSNHSNSHFHPYSLSHPRRSSSFLSIASSNSISSSDSVGNSLVDEPQLLTAELANNNSFTGPQVANVKTNTTLMDDIYPTKTYTEREKEKDNDNNIKNNDETNNDIIGTIPTTSSSFMIKDKDFSNMNKYDQELLESLFQK